MIIIYYSYSGKTRDLAQRLAEKLDADLCSIEEIRPRRGLFGFVRSGYESLREKTVPLKPLDSPRQLDSYEHVVIMGPIWAGSLSSPLRSFLVSNALSIKRYSQIMTCGDPKAAYPKAYAQAEKVLGKPSALKTTVSSSDKNFIDRSEDLARQLEVMQVV